MPFDITLLESFNRIESSLFTQVLFFLLCCVCAFFIQRISRLDLSLSCLIAGFSAAYSLPFLNFDTGIRAHNLDDIVFYWLLPVLVFDGAWQLEFSKLKRCLYPLLFMATIGILLGCIVFACGVFWGVNHSGFPWIAALLTGAILTATDPIATVARLKCAKVYDELITLFEGESVFNDAMAVVLFSVVLAVATSMHQESIQSVLTLELWWRFLLIFFGGISLGLIMGLIATICLAILADKTASQVLLLITAFASFYLAERVFQVSGIMAVMVAALLMRYLLRHHLSTWLGEALKTWQFYGVLCHALVFVLMGLVVQTSMFVEQWLAMLIAVIASLVARFSVVFLLGGLSRLSERPIGFTWQCILAWGGLRGAVSIALVLSLPTDLPYWWTVQSMVFGVVLFGLCVQGPTSGYVIRRFRQ